MSRAKTLKIDWSLSKRRQVLKDLRGISSTVVRRPELGPCLEMPEQFREKRQGYATWRVDGRSYRAHRLMYALINDKIEADMVTMHRCDNPPCIEPTHLAKGTITDNNKDRHEKGRTLFGEKAGGAKLTEKEAIVALKLTRAPFNVSGRRVAQIFGVHHKSIQRLISGEKWAHLER